MKLLRRHKRHSARCRFGWRYEQVDSTSITAVSRLVVRVLGDPQPHAEMMIGEHRLLLTRAELLGLSERFAEVAKEEAS